jgi:isoquinoline 1-oxidoreductase subunit beta
MMFSSRNSKLHCLWKGGANGEKATGVGEPAVTVIAPALGNAIFNACGARVSLPITAEAVKANVKA